MALEKLGIEKQQLKDELQSEYNRLTLKQHELQKEGSAAPQCALVANELEQVKEKLDSLQES